MKTMNRGFTVNVPLHFLARIAHHQKVLQHYRGILYIYVIHTVCLCIGIFTIKYQDLLHQVVKINILILFKWLQI
jgi:hypothetical protein